MTPSEIFNDLKQAFEQRKFVAGLLVAFIDFLTELAVPDLDISSLEEFFSRFRKKQRTRGGRTANTLIVDLGDGKSLSIRPFYNSVEQFFRADKKRFDYPSCAPHATQAWSDYQHWLDSLIRLSTSELEFLRTAICEFVLEKLESHEFDPSSIITEPPLFKMLLEDFDLAKHPGEKTGAALQGIVFGFLRADDPYLQIEVEKVRTGSKRLQRVGDIDGWEGARLAMSTEVKQYRISANDLVNLASFSNETTRRAALGIVAALEFDDGVRERIKEMRLHPLDIADMIRTVSLWHPLKQRAAMSALIYFVRHVEKSSKLATRIEAFITDSTESWHQSNLGNTKGSQS